MPTTISAYHMGPGYGRERRARDTPALDLLHLHCQALCLPRATAAQLQEKLNPYMFHSFAKDAFFSHLTTTMSQQDGKLIDMINMGV